MTDTPARGPDSLRERTPRATLVALEDTAFSFVFERGYAAVPIHD